MERELTIVARVLEARGVMLGETLVDATEGVRRGLEHAGFDLVQLDVRGRELPA